MDEKRNTASSFILALVPFTAAHASNLGCPGKKREPVINFCRLCTSFPGKCLVNWIQSCYPLRASSGFQRHLDQNVDEASCKATLSRRTH